MGHGKHTPTSGDAALLLFAGLSFPVVLTGLVLAFLGRLVFAGSAGLGFMVITGLAFAGLATLVLAGPTRLGCMALAGLVLVLAGLATVFVAGGALLLFAVAPAAGA